jgi:LysM repeat protein
VPSTEATPTATPPSVFYYTTREGDTVQSVADLFGIKAQDLAQANGIGVGTTLEPGTVLVIPGGGGH